MKKILTFALALLPLLCFAITPNDHTSMLRDFDRTHPAGTVAEDEEDPYFLLSGEADKALAEGDYITAVLRLREAMNVDPGNPGNVLLLSNLGMAYAMLDQDSLAMQAYDNALAIAPAMTTILNNRAMLKLKMGREEQAFADFATVLERDSLNATALYYHGMLSLYNRDLDTATRDFTVLESVEPDSYYTQAAMSQLYSLTSRERLAIPYYKKLIEQDPSAEYYAGLASCYLQTDDLSEASATLAEAMEQFPEDPDLYYCRAWLKKESYDLDGAKADARKAIQLGANPQRLAQLFK